MSKGITTRVLIEKLREYSDWLVRLDKGQWIAATELPLVEIIELPAFWPQAGRHPAGIALGPVVDGRRRLWVPGEPLVGFADTIFVNDKGEAKSPDILLTTAGAIRPAALPIPWQRDALERSAPRGFEIMTGESSTL